MPGKTVVICENCSKPDVTRPGHVGTNREMRCPDCAGTDGRAARCRKCCPTEHGTRWPVEAEGKR